MAKIGEEHLAAWMRQGLRELRGALYPDSNVAQQAEYGLYGTKTPGEVAEDRRDMPRDLEDEGPKEGDSILADRVRARAETTGERIAAWTWIVRNYAGRMGETADTSMYGNHADADDEPATVPVPSAVPAWITPELIALTIKTWQPYYEALISPEDAVTMILAVGRLYEVFSEGREP